jgi:deazaflavin-dependent oxidoreductase (nitroreductase family)
MADRGDWNRGVIEEFRANGGRVAVFAHQPLLLIHHLGSKTGTERVNPLAYLELDDGYAIFGSKGGAPTNPDWVANVLANPEVTVEVGTDTHRARARLARGDERAQIWEEQKRRNPAFAEYERKTAREIPVIILERVTEGREDADRGGARRSC